MYNASESTDLQAPDLNAIPEVQSGKADMASLSGDISKTEAQQGDAYKQQAQDMQQRQSDWQQAMGATPQNQIGYTMKQAPLLMALSALAGGHTRTAGLTALGSLKGMVQGIQAGSEQEYKDAQSKYQQALQNMQEQWKLRDQTYETLQKSFSATLEGKQRAWQIANAAVGISKEDAIKSFDMKAHLKQLQDAAINHEEQHKYQQSELSLEYRELKLKENASTGGPEDKGAIGMALAGMPLNLAVPGYGKDATAQRKATRDGAIKELMSANPGWDEIRAGKELAKRQVEYASGKASVGQLTKMEGASKAAVQQLDFNVKKASEFMDKLPAQTDISPVLNSIINKEQTWTGNPNMAGLFFYMNAVTQEAARLQSGGQASIAQLHQGAADEAKKWLDAGAITPASWKKLAPEILAEGQNRVQTFSDAKDAMEIDTRDEGDRSQGSAASSSSAPASGGWGKASVVQ